MRAEQPPERDRGAFARPAIDRAQRLAEPAIVEIERGAGHSAASEKDRPSASPGHAVPVSASNQPAGASP